MRPSDASTVKSKGPCSLTLTSRFCGDLSDFVRRGFIQIASEHPGWDSALVAFYWLLTTAGVGKDMLTPAAQGGARDAV